MVSFLRTLLASLVALIIFSLVAFFILVIIFGSLASSRKMEIGSKAVLVLDLSQTFKEQYQENHIRELSSNIESDVVGVYDIIRLLKFAQKDSAVKGIYIKSSVNNNGFSTSEEIRKALLEFKKAGKFIYAYGDVISQKAYYVANLADRIYCNPKGGVDWKGYATQVMFLKGALQKLEIEPQIFYAGKFKSATEPLREEKMTEASRLQTSEMLNSLYNSLLSTTATQRGIDSSLLRDAANRHLIQFAPDALKYKLVDDLKYDDQVKTEIKELLKIDNSEKINFVSLAKYAAGVDYKADGRQDIALIYAEGDIVDGKGGEGQIGGDNYRMMIRKARLNKDIKAIVIRINSGGGSSLASENMWREISLARKEKPVIISFGDVAASGGYYMSCNADSIFAESNTITGSIGVFSIMPNMQRFFNDKLGITFDGVKTAPDADEMSSAKPLTEMQKKYFQAGVDSIYMDFKTRVADGRLKTIDYIDSIAQGRVWVGEKALSLGLVDRMGGLQDAIECAARMSKVSSYRLLEYPETQSFFEKLTGSYKLSTSTRLMKEEFGEDGYRIYSTLKNMKAMVGTTQAKMPYVFTIE